MGRRARKHWLMKSEPAVYSVHDLARDGRAGWEGVRNYQARNYMRDEMRIGDLVFFYHSNARPPGVAGVARVCAAAYPDPTQFDPESDYYDASATTAAPRWFHVDIEHVETFDSVLALDTLKEHAETLDGLMAIQRGIRFSVQPVSKKHFAAVLKLAGAATRA